MKKISFFVIVAMLFLASCTPKNQVVINGDISGLDNIKVFLNIRENKNWITLDSCTVNNGKFQLKCIVDEPQLAYLLMEPQNIFHRTQLFLEPGKITITGNVEDTIMNIGGSKLHDEYQSVMEQSDTLDRVYKKLLLDYNAAQKVKNLMDMAATKLQLNEVENQQINIKKNYIKEHSKSPVSLVFITSELIYYASLEDLKMFKSWIDISLHNTKAMKEIDMRIAALQRFEAGQTVPDIALSDTAGIVRKLSELRGKYVMVDFWASWCRPCRMENPEIVAVYQDFHDKGFDIFAVSLDDNRKDWLDAIHKDKLTWIHVSELKRWNGYVSNEFCINSIPANILIDPEGKIIARNIFGNELHRILNELLNREANNPS